MEVPKLLEKIIAFTKGINFEKRWNTVMVLVGCTFLIELTLWGDLLYILIEKQNPTNTKKKPISNFCTRELPTVRTEPHKD